MRRRTLLSAAAAGTTALTGCLGDEVPDGGNSDGTNGNGDPTDDGTGTETPTEGTPDDPDEGDETTDDETPTGDDGSDGDDGTDDNRDADAPGVAGAEFERTGDCSDPDSTTVEFESSAAVVEGCIEGPNGCHEAILRELRRDDDRLGVVVTTEEESEGSEDDGDEMTACTEAIVQRGYRVEIRFDDEPAAVEVIHDGMDGEETVATAER